MPTPHTYLTIVAIHGHNNGSSSIWAIQESMRQLPGARGLLVSRQKPQDLPANIEWRISSAMNYRQYNLFLMYCLHQFIETDYALVVQDDGPDEPGQAP